MHHPTDRITHTTAFVTPVVEHWLEREIAQWVHRVNCSNDRWEMGREWRLDQTKRGGEGERKRQLSERGSKEKEK